MENNVKPSILSIGGNGLVGSRISELLSSEYTFTNVGNTQGINITVPESLNKEIAKDEYTFVILLAAKADVDGCEADKELGEQGEAWKINVEGTQNVVDACIKYGKKLIYVSTDFVFAGDKEEGEFYTEEDIPSPVNWYGETKYEGEKRVQQSGLDYVIVRPAYPYRASFDKKKDFVRAIMERLENSQEVTAITDHYFTPIFIDDFAFSIKALISQNVSGIYHCVGGSVLTPYESAREIAKAFDYDTKMITATTRSEFFAGRAKRPFNLSLKNDKIVQLGVKMRTFSEGLEELKKQL